MPSNLNIVSSVYVSLIVNTNFCGVNTHAFIFFLKSSYDGNKSKMISQRVSFGYSETAISYFQSLLVWLSSRNLHSACLASKGTASFRC